MLYDYVELADGTRITHSEVLADNTIKIKIERPRENGFDRACCHVPFREWESASGFSVLELDKLRRFLSNNAPLIWDFAEEASAKEERAK